jgi:hypothetical protein
MIFKALFNNKINNKEIKSTLLIDDISITMLHEKELYYKINDITCEIDMIIDNIINEGYKYLIEKLELLDVNMKINVLKDISECIINNKNKEIIKKILSSLYDVLYNIYLDLKDIYESINNNRKSWLSYIIPFNIDEKLKDIEKNFHILDGRLNIAIKMIA